MLYQALGDYARATTLFEQALTITKAALGEKHPSYATSLNSLAAQQALEGKTAQALRTARPALGIHQAHAETTFSTLSVRQRLELLAGLRVSLDCRLSLAAAADEPNGRRYAAVLAWKGAS